MAIAMMFSNLSLRNIPLSVYAIILNLKPVLVILLGFCFGVETITLKKIVLILISFLGASLIVDQDLFARWFESIFHGKTQSSNSIQTSGKGLLDSDCNQRTYLLFFVLLGIHLRFIKIIFFRGHKKIE